MEKRLTRRQRGLSFLLQLLQGPAMSLEPWLPLGRSPAVTGTADARDTLFSKLGSLAYFSPQALHSVEGPRGPFLHIGE